MYSKVIHLISLSMNIIFIFVVPVDLDMKIKALTLSAVFLVVSFIVTIHVF
jgi:hypothetical protein